MKKNLVSWDSAVKNGYIPAPYVLEEGEKINDMYLEPVLFHNENGPTIGVTTCGVIVKDGLYFKDMDNDGVLSPYEDWRLDDETRAKDMVSRLPLAQQAGLVLNTLWNSPLSMTREAAKDENGNLRYRKDKNQNKLDQVHIDDIFRAYADRVDVERFAHVASFEEIKANEFNLNIPRYVDTFEEEAEIDLAAVRAERLKLDAELAELEKKMAAYLKELGYGE